MTFFLNGPATPPKIKANNPDVDLDGLSFWGAGVPAATSSAMLTTDANLRARREDVKARNAIGWDIADKLGIEAVADRAREAGMPDSLINQLPKMYERRSRFMPPELSGLLFEMGNEAQSSDPSAWDGVDLTDEAVKARANTKMQAEYEDLQQTLNMLPGGRGMADFLGGMIGITADVKNIPFLLMGGGGSIARVMGREAAINVAAEGVSMPQQFQMAERLEIPDPDVATQLAMAAAGGAVFGGIMSGTQRGIAYVKGRNQTPPMAGFDDVQTRIVTDQAEDVLTSDSRTPMEDIQRLMEDAPRQPPYADVNPINPERPPLIETTPLERADGGPADPLPDNALIENAQKAIDEVETQDSRNVKPLVTMLRNNHRVTKKSIRDAEKEGRAAPQAGENLQIHPEGWMADELRQRGITTKDAPGLFSKKGRKDFDNLIADEMEEMFPGIREATGTEPGANYLDRDGFADVLTRDITGDSAWLRSRADAQAMQSELSSFEGRTARDDFLDTNLPPEPERGYVDLNLHHFETDVLTANANIEAYVRDWMDENGYGGILTEVEKREIVSELQRSGGQAEDLVERALERETDYVESPRGSSEPEDIPFGDIAGTAGPRAGRSDTIPPEAGGGAAREAVGPDAARQSESTSAGQQTLIDGVAPVSERQRLEAAQNAPMRGGDAAADHGLFDTGARAQRDMFSDPASKEARVIHDAVADDFRTQIEADGPTEMPLALDDGRVLKTDRDILDYLDEGDRAADFFDLCGRGPS